MCMCMHTPTSRHMDHFLFWSAWATYDCSMYVSVHTNLSEPGPFLAMINLSLWRATVCTCMHTPTSRHLDHFLIWSAWATYECKMYVSVHTNLLEPGPFHAMINLSLWRATVCACMHTPTSWHSDHFLFWSAWATYDCSMCVSVHTNLSEPGPFHAMINLSLWRATVCTCMHTPTSRHLDHFLFLSAWATYDCSMCVSVHTDPSESGPFHAMINLSLRKATVCICLCIPTCQNLDHFLL